MNDKSALRALSVRQPWAWLIINRVKHIENRTWPTNRRGTILIHSPLTIDKKAYYEMKDTVWLKSLLQFKKLELPQMDEFKLGGIIGQTDIINCVEASTDPFFTGPYGLELSFSNPLPFRPCKGALGFFLPTYEEARS